MGLNSEREKVMDTQQNENQKSRTQENNNPKPKLKDTIIGIIAILIAMIFLVNLCSNGNKRDTKPIKGTTEELGEMGIKAEDGHWLVLYGVVSDRNSTSSSESIFVFRPFTGLTKDSREVYCNVKGDVRAKSVNIGDIITISGFNYYNRTSGNIVIKECQFHGHGDNRNDAVIELTRKQ